MGATGNGNFQSPKDLASSIKVLREELLTSNMSSEEISLVIQAYANRPRVELVKPLEVWTDQDLEEEAARRNLSWLTLESDDDLLDEVERRRLMSTKTDLTEEEFEREAEKRGYRNSLAGWTIEEIMAYLRLQGHGGGGGNRGGSGGNVNRRGKKRQKGRRGNYSGGHGGHNTHGGHSHGNSNN